MRLLIDEHHDFRAWQAGHAAGNLPGELPYGLERLSAHGIEIVHVAPTDSWVGRVTRRIEYRVALPIYQPCRVARASRRADVVMTFFEDRAVALGLMKARGLINAPLVVILCWLAERVLSYPDVLIKRYARALEAADLVVCFSRNQPDVLMNRLGLSGELIHTVDFGVDPDFYTPTGDTHSGSVLVAGSDIGRDYGTLAKAARLTNARIQLVALEPNIRGFEFPRNVEFLGSVPHSEYRALLEAASVVVVPTHPFAYPSGQTVLLEAMMSGKPVIATDTPAIRDYVSEDVGVLVPAADPPALARALDSLLGDTALRQRMGAAGAARARARFTTNLMWDAVAPRLTALA